jgi:hypothetical protein
MAGDDMFEVPGDRLRELAEQYKALQKLTELPHVHKWDILGVWRPTRPAHPRMPNSNTTTVLLRCRVCNWPETSELNGMWTEDQIRKASSNE